MRDIVYHLFIPHHRNNFRAVLLHDANLLLTIFLLLSFTFSTLFIRRIRPDILGISYSISSQELLSETNKARVQNGIPPLTLNDTLSGAAQLKAQDMFAKNYWAHFAPDGTTPWSFIKNSGYEYLYAGENLAKGFVASPEVVDAWLSSSTHRDNMLSGKYTDVGFAIMEGKLLGEDTVLIVELFGATEVPALAQVPQQPAPTPQIAQPQPTLAVAIAQPGRTAAVSSDASVKLMYAPRFEITSVSRTILLTILSVFIGVLALDLIVVLRRRIPRLVGHNLDHIMLISLFLLFILVQRTGFIL